MKVHSKFGQRMQRMLKIPRNILGIPRNYFNIKIPDILGIPRTILVIILVGLARKCQCNLLINSCMMAKDQLTCINYKHIILVYSKLLI